MTHTAERKRKDRDERERKRERNLELNQIGPLTIEGDLREIRKGQIKYLARLSQIKFKQRRSSGYAPPRNAQKLFWSDKVFDQYRLKKPIQLGNMDLQTLMGVSSKLISKP